MRNEVNIALLVTDLDKGIRFYCEILSLFFLETDTDFGGGHRFVYIVFKDDSCPFAINLAMANDEEEKLLVGRQAGSQIFLVLPVPNCEQSYRELINRGVIFESGITELPYGKQVVCRDCFGNRISLFERYPSEPA